MRESEAGGELSRDACSTSPPLHCAAEIIFHLGTQVPLKVWPKSMPSLGSKIY